MIEKSGFLQACALESGSVVSIVGAGGKTSLLFQLAREARACGLKTLVTTTTRMRIPQENQYDHITLGGELWKESSVQSPGVYVAATHDTQPDKMGSVAPDMLASGHQEFDLVLIEADGAAGKSLKGWKKTEPVVVFYTTHTVGVLDIQAVGRAVDEQLVHRLDLFLELTRSTKGEAVNIDHLVSVVQSPNGLFQYSVGKRVLYINKVESERDLENTLLLKKKLPELPVVYGSLANGRCYG